MKVSAWRRGGERGAPGRQLGVAHLVKGEVIVGHVVGGVGGLLGACVEVADRDGGPHAEDENHFREEVAGRGAGKAGAVSGG